MKIHKIPEQKGLNENQEKSLHEFFLELVDLCNKYRVTFVVGKIFLLHKEVFDGKLLDLAGFRYSEKDECSYPVYIDRMS